MHHLSHSAYSASLIQPASTLQTMASEPAVAPEPRFVRPTRAHALELAQEMFLAGERLDMQTLSARLGVGRTTLYRWVGDRERLIGEVLARLTDIAWAQVAREANGKGRERAMDIGRRFMELTATFPPLRQFAEREPQLALRVLLARDGLVAARIRAGFQRALDENMPGEKIDAELVDIAVQAGTALEWAPIAIGGEPELDRAGLLIRSLFDTQPARRRR
jgi:AcrR family transcriptional regulator